MSLGACHPDRAPFDAAERKGIGHPDSLADLVADSFSRRYSAFCRDQFGAVPNHWEGHSKPGRAVLKISRAVTVCNTSGKSVMIRW